MLISILIPAYARPEQLAEALASIAQQDLALVGEILIGDDSPAEFRSRNQAAIQASGLAPRIRYMPSEPARGTYPNQWFLAEQAQFKHLLFLHNDDQLVRDALRVLVDACARETDSRVHLWFGTHSIMDEAGVDDAARTAASDQWYGRTGPAAARPVWEWCLTESIPSNAFLVERALYLAHMRGKRDGNVGDWAFAVRLANHGVWARFVGQAVSRYRVQAGSVTVAGRGVDVHRAWEAARALQVPPAFEAAKRDRFFRHMLVVAVRYARDGERLNAWRAFLSPDLGWRQRLSPRGGAVLAMLLTPRPLWRWALHYKS